MFNRSMLCALILGAGLISTQASAALVSTDWKTVGDAKATLDTVSGLEWLDLTVTAGNSHTSISENPSLFPGWRFPTITEVKNLFNGYLSYYTQRVPASGIINNLSHQRTEAVLFRNLFGMTYDGQDYRTNGFVYDEAKNRVTLFGFVTAPSVLHSIYTYDYTPGSYTLDSKYNITGWFLVSDGGTTLSSINDPMLNVNNPKAPVNQVPEIPADVPVHAGFGVLGLSLMAFGLRRRLKEV